MKYVRYKNSKDEVSIGLIKDNKLFSIDYSSIPEAVIDVNGENTPKIISQDNLDDIEFLEPTLPSKIICVGLNYRDHAEELHMQLPEEPLLFMKSSTSTIAHNKEIIYPEISNKVDYEAELGIVILEDIPYNEFDENAKIGYTIVNDVTARDLQEKDGQWTRAKNFDTFCPVGPYVVTGIDPSNLKIQLHVNGDLKQDSNTSNMIFSPKDLIKYISTIMTLNKGDVIATGTPPGVGQLQKGDVVAITIEKIGTLENIIK